MNRDDVLYYILALACLPILVCVVVLVTLAYWVLVGFAKLIDFFWPGDRPVWDGSLPPSTEPD